MSKKVCKLLKESLEKKFFRDSFFAFVDKFSVLVMRNVYFLHL